MSSHDAPNDGISFAHEDSGPVPKNPTWKVLLVDDEPDVHTVTRMALSGFSFAGKELEFISAHSGEEAKRAIVENPDTAVMLLDVVMETDHAGLDVARFVREDAGNQAVRIVLRTGQPGQAPENTVITNFDINDYKEKTELTAKKLMTLMYASLRSYRDIIALTANKRGLEHIIDASANTFSLKSMEQFATGVLEQLTVLLDTDGDSFIGKSVSQAVGRTLTDLHVVAATGLCRDLVGKKLTADGAPSIYTDIQKRLGEQKAGFLDDRYIGRTVGAGGNDTLLYMRGINRDISDLDRSLVEMFHRNIATAFERIELNRDIQEAQREIVYMLGEAVEARSVEPGNHIRRVAEISKLLALEYGLPMEEAEILCVASPLHDIGKIGIPDAILNKPGKLSDAEWEIMKTHAELGYDMLKLSKGRVLEAAAVIARDHHEKWDGSGYPEGKRGEEIHVYGRLTAVADVFDSLGNYRGYKAALPPVEILETIKQQRGLQFEPKMVDILLDNLDEVLAIRAAFPDEKNGPR